MTDVIVIGTIALRTCVRTSDGQVMAKTRQRRLGLVVNPIAGMGGAVGLKGTDDNLLEQALALGARPASRGRVLATLRAIATRGTILPRIVTSSGEMGAEVAAAAGFDTDVVHEAPSRRTSAEDTRCAAREIARRGVDLLLFAGGDGTARDLLEAVGRRLPILGIPCGVKMHSAVFATTPRAAADVARVFLAARDPEQLLHDAEVMDRNSSEGNMASPELFGFVRTPRVASLVVPAKSGPSSDALIEGACRRAACLAMDSRVSLIGPGSTMQRVKQQLGVCGTLLGVDAFSEGALLGLDLNEQDILALLEDRPARIILSIVGGQGFLFGRGNQQLSSGVIRAVGKKNIVIVASSAKLSGFSPNGLRVDTGDETLDDELTGYLPVMTGARRHVMMPVRSSAGRHQS